MKSLITFAVLVLVTLIAVGLLVSSRRRTTGYDKNGSSLSPEFSSFRSCRNQCFTNSCLRTANDILDYLNNNIDPCDDFFLFACGNYKPSNDRTTSLIMDRQDRFLRDLSTIISGRLPKNSVLHGTFSKIQRPYQNCLKSLLDESSMTAVSKILHRLGLRGWPFVHPDWQLEDKFEFISKLNAYGEDSLLEIKNIVNHGCNNCSVRHTRDSGCSLDVEVTIGESRLMLWYKEYMLANSTSGRFTGILEELLDLIRKVFSFFELDDYKANIYAREVVNFEREIASFYESNTRPLPRNISRSNPSTGVTHKCSSNASDTKWCDFIASILNSIGLPVKVADIRFRLRDENLLNRLKDLIDRTPDRILANYLVVRLIINHMTELDFFKIFSVAGNEIYKRIVRWSVFDDRWRFCINWLIGKFSTFLAHLYIQENFSKESTDQVRMLFDYLKRGTLSAVDEMTWVGNTFHSHLRESVNRVQLSTTEYLEAFKDSSEFVAMFQDLEFTSEYFFEDSIEYNRFSWKYNMHSQCACSPKRSLYASTVFGVNANAREDVINVGFGFFGYPVYDYDRPLLTNSAKLGQVIAHEMGHTIEMAISDYTDIPDNVRTEFTERGRFLVAKYSEYKYIQSNVSLDGNRTLSENVADVLALSIMYRTFKRYLRFHDAYKLPGLEFTGDKEFFLMYGQMWCEFPLPHSKAVMRDYHSPGKYRVIGTMSNMKEFSDAFQCNAGTLMNPERKRDIFP